MYGERRGVCRVLVGKPEGKGPLGRPRHIGRIILKPIFQKWDWESFFFVIFLVIEHRWNEIGRGKPKYSGKNLSQCHFVHHKSHMD
jgi:hypothetical protein